MSGGKTPLGLENYSVSILFPNPNAKSPRLRRDAGKVQGVARNRRARFYLTGGSLFRRAFGFNEPVHAFVKRGDAALEVTDFASDLANACIRETKARHGNHHRALSCLE